MLGHLGSIHSSFKKHVAAEGKPLPLLTWYYCTCYARTCLYLARAPNVAKHEELNVL